MIIRTLIAAAVALPLVGLQPAKAYEAPWCAVIENGTGSVYWDCQYRSIEECRPNVLAGNRGWCNPSPYFVAEVLSVIAALHKCTRRHNEKICAPQIGNYQTLIPPKARCNARLPI
jgi:Protein of unknown function (DUF3551)